MKFLSLVLLTLLLIIGCGGGGSDDDPIEIITDDPADPTNDPDNTTGPTIEGFDFSLRAGDFWEFGWDGTVSRFAQGSGGSTSRQSGQFRVTLGAARNIDGIPMHEILISGNPMWGDSQDFTPRWLHVGIADNKIYGSINGTSLEVVFDATTGAWSGGGFFSEFPDDTLIIASQGSISNDYINDSQAIRVGRSSSQSQCETILGITLCGDESFNRTEWEYFKPGLGLLGYRYFHSWSFSGGGFSSGGSDTYDVGLTATSLRGDSLDYSLEVESNNAVVDAMPLSLPANVRGDALSEGEDHYGGSTAIILNSVDEIEANDSDNTAQDVLLPVLIRGTIAATDNGTLTTSNPPGYNSYQTSIEDWYHWQNDPRTLRLLLEYDPASEADLDLMMGGLSFFDAYSVKDNNAENDYTEVINIGSFDQTSGEYRVVVDAYLTPNGPVDYTLRIDTYTTALDGTSRFANEVTIADWFQFQIANASSINIEVTGGPSVVIMDASGNTPIAFGIPQAAGGNASITGQLLEAGQYLVGVSNEGVEYGLSVTSQ